MVLTSVSGRFASMFHTVLRRAGSRSGGAVAVLTKRVTLVRGACRKGM
jgi:hypothetical protein